jgi:hypothetical protein
MSKDISFFIETKRSHARPQRCRGLVRSLIDSTGVIYIAKLNLIVDWYLKLFNQIFKKDIINLRVFSKILFNGFYILMISVFQNCLF